jgi:hypothetical protein
VAGHSAINIKPYLRVVVGELSALRSLLRLEQHLHDLAGVRHELLAADGQADERDALDRLAAEKPQLRRCRVLDDVLEAGNKTAKLRYELTRMDRI